VRNVIISYLQGIGMGDVSYRWEISSLFHIFR